VNQNIDTNFLQKFINNKFIVYKLDIENKLKGLSKKDKKMMIKDQNVHKIYMEIMNTEASSFPTLKYS